MLEQALLDLGGLSRVAAPVAFVALLLRQLGLGVEFLQLGLESLHLVAGEHAGVVAVLVVLLIRCGEEGGQFGQAQAVLFHLGQHLGELALQDVVVRDEFRPPAGEGDGFELGLEELEVTGQRAADLMVGE